MEPAFRIDASHIEYDIRLSTEEIKRAAEEVKRIAQLEFPHSDWSMQPVAVTNGEWHRQKTDARWRTILQIKYHEKVIVVKAILLRDEKTYVTVRRLWLAD